MTASIEPYGLMTKSGKMKELGAVGFYDFELKAKINNRLSTEKKKGFIYVKERAHIGARYHQAVFLEYVPRFWAINMGQDAREMTMPVIGFEPNTWRDWKNLSTKIMKG